MLNKRLLPFYLLLLCFNSFGQIVNIENQRLAAKKEGFSGNLDINLNFTVNTKTLIQVGSKLRLVYKKKRHYWLLLSDQSLVKSNEESFINNGFEHIRFNYALKDSGRVTYEVYQQGQFNKIQRINMRLLLGTGFRFLIVDKQNYQFNLGTGLMGEYEEIIDGIGSYDVLSANYASFDAQFTAEIGLNTITYFQPKLIDLGNYRLSNETSLRFKVNKYLTFKLTYALTHDSRNIQDVRKTNYTFKNTLSFNF
jgi:putative salt-induced outer membrane protein YdiY